MKKTPTNQHYFEISKSKKEESIDDFYVFDEKHKDIKKYIENTKEIKNILITIKTLQEKREKDSVINKYFLELSRVIGEYSNCSEFACFINACDNVLDDTKDDLNLLKKITERYFEKRELNELAPEEWIQAILDGNSSRKKGQCGEKKLMTILESGGFKKVSSWDDFKKEEYSFVKFSNKFNLKNTRKELNVKIKTKKQNKSLDLIIKAKEKVFFCEAKHINTSGGGQDKQISELIEILGLKEKNNKIGFIAFLDGSHSNALLSDDSGCNKIETQKKEIKEALRKNPGNYWLNTAGFKSFIKDLK